MLLIVVTMDYSLPFYRFDYHSGLDDLLSEDGFEAYGESLAGQMSRPIIFAFVDENYLVGTVHEHKNQQFFAR
jgi:hypothetical protein